MYFYKSNTLLLAKILAFLLLKKDTASFQFSVISAFLPKASFVVYDQYSKQFIFITIKLLSYDYDFSCFVCSD